MTDKKAWKVTDFKIKKISTIGELEDFESFLADVAGGQSKPLSGYSNDADTIRAAFYADWFMSPPIESIDEVREIDPRIVGKVALNIIKTYNSFRNEPKTPEKKS